MVQSGELALTPNDSIAVEDTIVSEDTIVPVYGVVLEAPAPPEAAPLRSDTNTGISFIFSGLFILFLIIALRYRNNVKYIAAMFRNLVETRTRQNVFDDTVRETSLIVLLNIMWVACVGIIGYGVYAILEGVPGGLYRSVGMLIGMGIAGVYSLFMWGAYGSVGWIFSDRSHSMLWVKGFSASQALMAPAFFITALISLCRPETSLEVGIMSATVFILGKLVFIWKGYRIFFKQFSSWVLFLCYLCSLEIVPLILCYRIATLIGSYPG